MLKNKYRVVTDTYLGYEAQVKFWWFPIKWWMISRSGRGVGINTNRTLEDAELLCRMHRSGAGIYKVEV